MRPKVMATFERLSLLSILLSVAQVVAQGDGEVDQAYAELGTAILGSIILLTIMLVFLASRKRSDFARWALVSLAAFGLLSTGEVIILAIKSPGRVDALVAVDAVAAALQLIAVMMLFSREARAWFADTEKSDGLAVRKSGDALR